MSGTLIVRPTGLPEIIRAKPRALTVKDLASILNVSERQIYKLASERRIPFFRIGGSIRFEPAATSLWLRQKMASAGFDLLENRRRHA